MGIVALLACVSLATIFVVSGVAKLTDRDGTREAVAGFGVPPSLVQPVALGLAPAEIVVAVLVLVPATAAAGLVLALGLLLAFTAAVVIALRAGRRPECHCFGRIGGADVSARTVVRNLALAGLAVVGIVGLATSDPPSGAGVAVGILGGLAVAAVAVGVEGLAGRAARRRRQVQDEAAYDDVQQMPVSDFGLPTLAGVETSLTELLAPGLPLLLVSLSPGCGPCKRLRLTSPSGPSCSRTSSRWPLSPAAVRPPTHRPTRTSRTCASWSTRTEPCGSRWAPRRPRPRWWWGRTRSSPVAWPAVSSWCDGSWSASSRGPSSTRHRCEPEELDADATSVEDLNLSSVVTPRPGVQPHGLGESTVLMDTGTGATVVLDQIGALVWSVLDGESPLDEIVTDLAEVYGVPADRVGADVLELVRTLGRSGLLAGVAPQRGHAGPALTHDHAGA